MPEHQASSSEPSPLHSSDAKSPSDRDATAPPPPETAKRTYLSLLPPPQLIDLILAFDANRQTLIFPHDLDSAIKALQRPHRLPSPQPTKGSPPALSVVVKAETASTTIPPVPSTHTETPSVQPPTQPPVQPPQYTPPAQYYPYTHTPYYPPPLQRPQQSTYVPPPSAPPRNPLFTSVPLNRDPNRPPAPPPPPPPVSSRDDPNAMPSYEEMLVEAIMDVGDADGTAPKVLFSWMASHYPLQQNFRPSASQALHKALKRGRLEKIGGKYRLNPSWGGGPTTSKRATRRPTANSALSPHTQPRTHPQPPPHPPPHPHSTGPPHGQLYTPQPSQYGFPPYLSSNPSVPPPPLALAPATVENDRAESEEMEGEDEEDEIEVEGLGDGGKETFAGGQTEEIRRSLVRLATVLKKIANKGGAG